MKIKITSPGIYGAKGEIEVGSVFAISGEPPSGWRGKYVVVEEDPVADAKPVTNGGEAKKVEAKKPDAKE